MSTLYPVPDSGATADPLVQRADSRKFEMLSLDGRRMQIPRREVVAPHRAALEWHRENVFRG
jgi:predicted restriction endonuclease